RAGEGRRRAAARGEAGRRLHAGAPRRARAAPRPAAPPRARRGEARALRPEVLLPPGAAMSVHTPAFAPEPGAAVRRMAAQAQQSRLRAFADALWRTGLAALLSAALSAAAWQGWRWATTADAFTVNYISFTG